MTDSRKQRRGAAPSVWANDPRYCTECGAAIGFPRGAKCESGKQGGGASAESSVSESCTTTTSEGKAMKAHPTNAHGVLIPCATCGRELHIPRSEAEKTNAARITCSFTCRTILVEKGSNEA